MIRFPLSSIQWEEKGYPWQSQKHSNRLETFKDIYYFGDCGVCFCNIRNVSKAEFIVGRELFAMVNQRFR